MIVESLDTVRYRLLKTTLNVSAVRLVYLTRAYRLFAFFVASVVFNFFIATAYPLWALLLGPLILGVPHLLSSIRYLPKLTHLEQHVSYTTLYRIIGGVYILIAVLRLFVFSETSLFNSYLPNFLELAFCTLFLIMIGYFSKVPNIRLLSSFIVLGCLCVMSFQHPLETLGFLVIAHNFVAFYFWIIRASEKKEQYVAIIALFLFSVISGAFLLGSFDNLMHYRPYEILNGLFSERNIGSQIFPAGEATLWMRAVSAYAFGQGVHYFIWLKAIPEQELRFQHSTSFATSLVLLKNDMGLKLIYIALILALAIVGYGLLVNFIQARIVYLSLAALHGYLEIMSLALTNTKSS